MNRKKLISIFLSALLIIYLIYSISINRNEESISNTYYNLGTINEITLYDVNKKTGEKILEECGSILMDIDNKMSNTIKSSDVSKINKNAGKDYTKVSKDTYYVIKESIEFSNISNDTFDISVGPLIDLWSIGTDNAKVPNKEEIENVLPLVDYSKILLNDENLSVKLSEENMKIDLGGIAKGYAADKIYDYLKSQNIKSAIINLGGNILTLGSKNNDQPFSIGIQDPTMPRGNSIGNIKVTNKSVVTSGIYERYIEKDNKIYHHMLNPHTGYPFENNLNSVTIVSDESIICDALSTTTFGLGLDNGMKLIESLDNVDAIFITKDKKIYLSSNLKDKFNLTDTSFSIE